MDAWGTLAAHSVAGDAWERLNGLTGGGNTPGEPIKELSFAISQPTVSGAISIPSVTGSIIEHQLAGAVAVAAINGVVTTQPVIGLVDVEEI